MSEETIVIKTEEVKVSDLQGREKQIYDYAYARGRDDTIIGKRDRIWRAVVFCIIGVIFILALLLQLL